MATADELLREAQYAFHSISFCNTRENRRNKARAKSLSQKIIRKFPDSIEARQARSILDKLQGTAHTPRFEHNHASDSERRLNESPLKPIGLWVESPAERSGERAASTTNRPADNEREPISYEQQEDAKSSWRKIGAGFVRLELSKQLAVIAGVVLVAAFFGIFPFVLIGVAIYFSGRLEKQNPVVFRRIRSEFMKPVDAWLRGNQSK